MRIAAATAFLLTLVLTPLVAALLTRARVLDVAGERSSHQGAIPRGGGVAIVAGAVGGFLISGAVGNSTVHQLTTLLVLVVLMAGVGMLDDRRPLSVVPRLAAQALAAAACLPYVLDNVGGPLGWEVVAAAAAFVWVVGFVNAFNFMDGINGISAVTATIAGVSLVATGLHIDSRLVVAGGSVVAAASLGFLPWNFPRAKVFMGDVGSYFLGAWLSFMVLVALVSDVPPEAALAPLALYVVDTGTTLVRRALRREDLTRPHRQHVYQRLCDHGWSHTRVTLVVGSVTAACAALGLVSLVAGTTARLAALLGIALLLAGYLLLPRAIGVAPLPATATAPAQPPTAPKAPAQPTASATTPRPRRTV